MKIIDSMTRQYLGAAFERCPQTYREIVVPMQACGAFRDGSKLDIALDFCGRASRVLGRTVTVYENADRVFDEVERRLSRAYTSHAENAGNG